MARLFTQEDIDRMIAMNKDMTGVKVGSVMLPREVDDLGYGAAAEDPAPETVTAPVTRAPAPVATVRYCALPLHRIQAARRHSSSYWPRRPLQPLRQIHTQT